jgi:toxin-antitoxin system PIN domain toxin
MMLVDVNIVVYAINKDAARHEKAREWWDEQLSGTRPVCLPWAVILGFIRIVTNPRILQKPLHVKEALDYVDSWLDQACVRTLDPTETHWSLVKSNLGKAGTGGNLTTDAHLAALAIEHGCELYSTDSDFSRFPDLRWRNPLL